MAKFNKGDEVEVISNNSTGTIKEVTSYSNDDNVLYIVIVDGKEKIYQETNLRMLRKYNNVQGLNLDDVSTVFKIEDKFNEITNYLKLSAPETTEDQLVNACKLHMYLATVNYLSDDLKDCIKSVVSKNEIYQNIVDNKVDSIINAYLFSEILNRLGNKVLNVALIDENNEYYIANLVLINDDYYYFDVTLEHTVFLENGGELKNFVLCCGALGKGSYEQFFKPVSLVDFHGNNNSNELPSNIARLDIDIDLVNKLISI